MIGWGWMTTLEELNQYLSNLIDFTYKVVQSLKGMEYTESEHIDVCELLTMKLYCHATTINYLRNGTQLNLSDFDEQVTIFDFSSIMVLARAVIETYLTLYEVFFEPQTEDELNYRANVFKLSALITWENFRPNDPKVEHEDLVKKNIAEIISLRNRIKNTQAFQSLDHNQQPQALKGRIMPRRDFTVRAKAAGLGEKTAERMYAYLSSYLHSDSVSAVHLREATTNTKEAWYIGLGVNIVMIVLAKTILLYRARFKQAKAVCKANPIPYAMVEGMSKAADQWS